MKFSREKLIKIIKEEYNRVQKEAENAEIDPESAAKQLDWMGKSMKKAPKKKTIKKVLKKNGSK